jgi:hypothetical protein
MSVPLPPLPHVAAGLPAGRNVADVLAGEHRALLGLCAQLADPELSAGRRRRLAEVVVATTSRHLSAEEQYLYPAVRAAVPEGDLLADRELAEDHALLLGLRELAAARPGDADFDRFAETVRVQLRRHADVAADEVLPLLLQMATPEELIRLGNRVETAEEAAPTRPHPGAPSMPPWNKVIDPALGVVDRVRDALGRRVTFADEL